MTLYISDLDGTLLNSSKKLKPRAADMLNDMIENGVMFTYCTARSFNSAGEIMKDLKPEVPVALMNGAFIYDTNRNEYIRKNFPDEKARTLLKETTIRLGETPMIHSVIDGEIRVSYINGSENLKTYINDHKSDKRMRPLDSYEKMFDGEVFYAVFLNPKNKDALDIAFTAENGFSHTYYRDVYQADEYWYEVFSVTASKSNAVRQLKEITGADEVVCFGDSNNDLPMFGVSDRRYAVENASDEVKAAADDIIGSNDELAVPIFIEREHFERFDYIRPENNTPDNARFSECIEKRAFTRKRKNRDIKRKNNT